ncbi:hypothetical protein M3Y95_00356100 [Aphelenchoides besseyi]|nr:hypothetical protein M3Y95_00356100 [Aphelenchoides besseyi]
MMVFGLVLGGCWKSMFKRFNIGAVLMLLFVMLTTMFVAAETTSCWKANTLEGSCSVNVKTNASSIKATIEIKRGSGDFKGSITIGNCTIPGTFYANSQTFEPDTDSSDSFKSPIKVEATSTAVTFQSGTNPKKPLCLLSPFDVHDGLVRTTITLKLDSGNIVSLKLDDSIAIDNKEESGNGFPVWGIVLICIGASAVAIAIVVGIIVWRCCCQKDDELDDDLQNGGKRCCGLAKKSEPSFKIPEEFEWTCFDLTRQEEDQLLEWFPVMKLSEYQLQIRIRAFLKQHPITEASQLKNLKREYQIYYWYAIKNASESGQMKPTREYQIQYILFKIIQYVENPNVNDNEEPPKKKKGKKKKKMETALEKTKTPLAKSVTAMGTTETAQAKTATAVQKKNTPAEKKNTPVEKKEAPLEQNVNQDQKK